MIESDQEPGRLPLFAKKKTRAGCAHTESVIVRSPGIERVICEMCGKVSIQARDDLSGRADRRQFQRESERVDHAVV
jgi:hypothetical protein